MDLFIKSHPRPLPGLQINPDDKTLSVAVSPSDDIQTVKKKIQELEAIPVTHQRLTFLGQPVLGNTPLSAIGENSLLHFTWEDQAEIPAEGKLAKPLLS